jgi:hypothetical protein
MRDTFIISLWMAKFSGAMQCMLYVNNGRPYCSVVSQFVNAFPQTTNSVLKVIT